MPSELGPGISPLVILPRYFSPVFTSHGSFIPRLSPTHVYFYNSALSYLSVYPSLLPTM